MLVRPETVEVETVEGADGGVLAGEILSHTFLGPVTRLKVAARGGELTVDMPAGRAAALPVGARVRASFPAGSARILTLEDEPASPAATPDDR